MNTTHLYNYCVIRIYVLATNLIQFLYNPNHNSHMYEHKKDMLNTFG